MSGAICQTPFAPTAQRLLLIILQEYCYKVMIDLEGYLGFIGYNTAL